MTTSRNRNYSGAKPRLPKNLHFGAVWPFQVSCPFSDVAAGLSLNTVRAFPPSVSNPTFLTKLDARFLSLPLLVQTRAQTRSPALEISAGLMSTSDVVNPSTDLSSNITPDQHASLGIKLHERGELHQSSYHLRKAAHGSDVTGMILYGLALRHGWGLRVNATEAFMWLNTAASCVAADKDLERSHSVTSIVGPDPERGRNLCGGLNKESKAQLGLAMYELGVSYLNSWGVAKDEYMAMTCFELGAQLGDPDAMYELAVLWCRNGPGRKKDLNKAAALYREAADKGVSTVGNCWYWVAHVPSLGSV
jgi:hypothetical protein